MSGHDAKRPKPPSLEEVKQRRKPVRNVNVEHQRQLTKMELLALR
jgi:hypothetical protein